jgi:hypothetical protein
MAFNEKIFWSEEFNGESAKGGIFTRAFELRQFLELVEEKGQKVVGLRFDGNNLEVIVTGREDE